LVHAPAQPGQARAAGQNNTEKRKLRFFYFSQKTQKDTEGKKLMLFIVVIAKITLIVMTNSAPDSYRD
jgi:hypothetical protein